MKILAVIILILTITFWRRIRTVVKFLLFFIAIMLFVNDMQTIEISPSLWYDAPADRWEACIPMGNGRIGMMPDGGVDKEKVVLNDITMWSGSEADYSNDKAKESLDEIRELLLNGKNHEAQQLMYGTFTCGNKGSNYGAAAESTFGCYQMLGTMEIDYKYDHDESQGEYVGYRRGLDLNNAMSFVEFSKDNVKYRREYFVSRDGDVAIIHLTADKNNKINLAAGLSRDDTVSRIYTRYGEKGVFMRGQLHDGTGGNNGVRYFSKLVVDRDGGSLNYVDNRVKVENANEVTLIFSSATDFYKDDLESFVEEKIEKSVRFSYNKLKRDHTKSYRELYDRVELGLGENVKDAMTTEEQLADYQIDEDPAFAALYFNYGRYLFISSTKEGLLPPNLQGLWANTIQTPWNGDYHLNINLQMNHWLVNVCNMPELNKPLIEFTKGLVPSGEETAKGFYGVDGWVSHWATNVWHFTAPGEDPSWGATNTGGAWLCEHLFNHYLYTQDIDYLREIYPVMKGSARFFHSIMIEEPTHKWLVTAPTSSPENAFIDENGRWTYTCMGSTMDVQIITELYRNVIFAYELLVSNNGDDSSSDTCDNCDIAADSLLIAELKADMMRFPPMQISDGGYLQEWLEDYKETDINHRHVSHLFGLYPANLITETKTPEVFDACKVALNRRGDEGTGWSRAWKINFWARLHDGERAGLLLKKLLTPAVSDDGVRVQAGTYPNLFCAHPPFQIDGNFGGTAGIAEMLLQSHDGFVDLIPAIPSSWKNGYFKGLCTVGGAAVDCDWENGNVTKVRIHSKCGGTYKIRIPGKKELEVVTLSPDGVKTLKIK